VKPLIFVTWGKMGEKTVKEAVEVRMRALS